MRIDSSAVVMASDRQFSNTTATTSYLRMTKEGREAQSLQGSVTSQTEESKSAFAELNKPAVLLSLNDLEAQTKARLEDSRLERLKNRLTGGVNLKQLPPEEELSLVEQILNAIDEVRGEKPRFRSVRTAQASRSSMRSLSFKMEAIHSGAVGHVAGRGSGGTSQVAAYQYSQVTTRTESEATSFTAKGVARTKDGREIAFNVDVSMTREFVQRSSFSASLTQDMKLVDPLVVNLDGNVASVSDQKFTFDIDADGNADVISRLGQGSGFIALDKNNDGVINDGSELFGAQTGDGFAELAAYDEDGNGWIDEADSVFNDLKVWTQNEDGTDRLVAIAQADVGAIYLGSVDTDFSLTNSTASNADALIRRSGVYLKESGGVGTVQHLDFVL